ncbi:MAG: ISNCY family transposase [Candidatus Taylorbacteria bacterium CG11_big_fil_rev_8_21_14_0_20_46_11]|uniref:ISNCY family transposase n=1 Tax=Candidatus Taylorbacteria bacterium CG11_big_fil_rev_8_21_14_0_20_46_11 TaxID=1975025 RepID=A0A2H0KBQ9_9BACT|nr:MAG: ISNCY family transposase [Candidatus Taylorbacteria bacterium CG11_big_fil_rev_8_21_14_0_20_46_11]
MRVSRAPLYLSEQNENVTPGKVEMSPPQYTGKFPDILWGMKTITMTEQEAFRFETINKLINKKTTISQAVKTLDLSKRQIKRIRKRVRDLGTEGVVHKGRGKESNRKIPADCREKAEKLLKEKYSDFGPTFAAEKLCEDHSILISKETVRTIMIGLDLHKVKSRKKNREYHAWRPRKEYFGEMQQFDGSYHHWFEDRNGEHCLLASIDDATGRITKAVFAKNEGVMEVARFWKEYSKEHGKPLSLYLDKFSTYKVNHANATDNHELLTQFERMTERVGIKLITAHSPEAKGRIERLFETLQDRLVKEMRLLSISSEEEGNQYLKDVFIPKFNAKFGVVPSKEGDVHRPLSESEEENIMGLFSIQKTRRISNDFCIQFENQWIQMERDQPTLVCRKDIVVVEKRIDGTLHAKLREKYLNFKLIPERPIKLRQKITALVPSPIIRESIRRKPKENHPWRRSFLGKNQNRQYKIQCNILTN